MAVSASGASRASRQPGDGEKHEVAHSGHVIREVSGPSHQRWPNLPAEPRSAIVRRVVIDSLSQSRIVGSDTEPEDGARTRRRIEHVLRVGWT